MTHEWSTLHHRPLSAVWRTPGGARFTVDHRAIRRVKVESEKTSKPLRFRGSSRPFGKSRKAVETSGKRWKLTVGRGAPRRGLGPLDPVVERTFARLNVAGWEAAPVTLHNKGVVLHLPAVAAGQGRVSRL